MALLRGEPTIGKTKPETILRQLTTKKGQVFTGLFFFMVFLNNNFSIFIMVFGNNAFTLRDCPDSLVIALREEILSLLISFSGM